jgi:hypothetical protein
MDDIRVTVMIQNVNGPGVVRYLMMGTRTDGKPTFPAPSKTFFSVDEVIEHLRPIAPDEHVLKEFKLVLEETDSLHVDLEYEEARKIGMNLLPQMPL